MVTESARNFAYRLAGSQNIDAALVLASTFATFGGIEPVRTLLATVDVPQISAGIGIPGGIGVVAPVFPPAAGSPAAGIGIVSG